MKRWDWEAIIVRSWFVAAWSFIFFAGGLIIGLLYKAPKFDFEYQRVEVFGVSVECRRHIAAPILLPIGTCPKTDGSGGCGGVGL